MQTKFVTIRVQSSDMAALFDMLRYEGGRVLDWDRGAMNDAGRTPWSLTIEVEGGRHQPARWLSFGIKPYIISAR